VNDRSQIRAICFDLDDTLWPIWPAIVAAETALQQWFAVEHPAVSERFDLTQMRAVRDAVALELPHLAHDFSAIRLHSIERLLALGGADPARAHAGFEVFYAARNAVALYDDTASALARLRQRFALYTLTNGNADLQRMGLDHWFAQSFSARALGFAKPDPRGFAAVTAAAGLQPQQLLHVGDHPEQDVMGAINAGVQAVWLNRTDEPWPLTAPAPRSVKCLETLADLLLD
jgi:FMN hydrolase / 5-amino-6-(5-phospho-D-ribitylamino)uracil phosphatase